MKPEILKIESNGKPKIIKIDEKRNVTIDGVKKRGRVKIWETSIMCRVCGTMTTIREYFLNGKMIYMNGKTHKNRNLVYWGLRKIKNK